MQEKKEKGVILQSLILISMWRKITINAIECHKLGWGGGFMWFWVSKQFSLRRGSTHHQVLNEDPRAGGSAPGSSPPGAGEGSPVPERSSGKWLAPPSGDGMMPHRTHTCRHHHTQKSGPVCFRKHVLDLFMMLNRNVFLHKDREAIAWLTNEKAIYYIWCWGIPWQSSG